jgi:hypothetical protein
MYHGEKKVLYGILLPTVLLFDSADRVWDVRKTGGSYHRSHSPSDKSFSPISCKRARKYLFLVVCPRSRMQHGPTPESIETALETGTLWLNAA